MGSPNRNNATKHGRSMSRTNVCKKCSKKYAMIWAKDNHEKICQG